MTPDEVRACLREEDARSQPFRLPSEHMVAFYSARPRFRIDKARRLLGFQPAFDFRAAWS